MLDSTRALRADLEEDPEVLYFTGIGPEVEATSPAPALPWNAVEVLADSAATVRTPANLREADRAYAAYAVVRMRGVRRDPDIPCDSLMAREVEAVSAFVDGWIVTRVLFGGPPFPPLDEVVFARRAGRLSGMIAAREDPYLGGCLATWRESHGEEVRGYREWRRRTLEDGDGGVDRRP